MADTDSIARHPRFIDLTGQRRGQWTVLHEIPHESGKVHWACRCACGAEGRVQTSDLRSGKSRCCAKCSKTSTVHGMHGTPEYIVWKGMRARCGNQNAAEYINYGGRGIRICDRWSDFALFFLDMGPRPSPKHSIERKDNDLGYCKDNCKWATKTEQARNSRKNHLLTFNDETRCLSEWAGVYGMKPHTLLLRLRRGWSVERALTTPVKH